MAEEKPSLHIDLDWKKQAQEEKRRLEEEEKKRAAEREAARAPAAAAPAGLGAGLSGGLPEDAELTPPVAAGATAPRGRGAARGARGERVLPPASIPTLAQSLATQISVYLGDMMQRDEVGSMDMAKHLIDTLGVVEEKTKGNLNEEEQRFLDLVLYETRMRYIGVAGQVIAGT